MRKWDEPPSQLGLPDVAPAGADTVRQRARVFRRWLSRGAEPGGLRALAREEAGGAYAADERAPVCDLDAIGGADEAHRPRRTP